MVQVNVLTWPESQTHTPLLGFLLFSNLCFCPSSHVGSSAVTAPSWLHNSLAGQPCHERICSYTRHLTSPSCCSALKQSENKAEHSARPFSIVVIQVFSCLCCKCQEVEWVVKARAGLIFKLFRPAHLNSNSTITIVLWCKSAVMFNCLQPCCSIYFSRTEVKPKKCFVCL